MRGHRHYARSTDERVSAQKPPKESVLIVCEGAKTEPDYFTLLGRELDLIGQKTYVEVNVKGKECGSAPISVVEYAIKIKDDRADAVRNSNIIREFDFVYCAIDRDKHSSSGLNDAYQKAKKNDIHIILSNPCFEYWFLLHFGKYAKSFLKHGDAEKVLKKKYPKYNKNKVDGEFFDSIYGKTNAAIRHAKEVIREKHWGKDLRNCNPSTHVYRLVEYLRKMSPKPYKTS